MLEGESREPEFADVTLTVDGGPQQVDEMKRALKAYCNKRGLAMLSTSIEKGTKFEQKDFVTTKMNPDNYMVLQNDGSKIEDAA